MGKRNCPADKTDPAACRPRENSSEKDTAALIDVYTSILSLLRWNRALCEGKALTPEKPEIMNTPWKKGILKSAFRDGCVRYDDLTCRKL